MSSVVIPASSFTAEFCEGGFDLLRRREAAFRGVAQPAIDAGEFFRRRLIVATLKSGVEFEREVGKFILRLGRSRLDALQNLGQFFGFHGFECSTIAVRCLRQRTGTVQIARGKSVLDAGAPIRLYPVIPGRANGPRRARPDDANPESRTTALRVWIPGSREDARPGMTSTIFRVADRPSTASAPPLRRAAP
jgi:hypothetical protein